MTDAILESMLRRAVQGFADHAATMSNQLRRAADDLDREAQRVVHPDTDSLISVTAHERSSWIINELTHLVPNLQVETLMKRALDVDQMRKEVAAEKEAAETGA